MTRRQVVEVQLGPEPHIQQRVVAGLEPSDLETTGLAAFYNQKSQVAGRTW
jgi:hypothetical protein